MATAQELATLRDYINEPDDENGWTEEKLEAYLTTYGSLYRAAGAAWSVKASGYAELVNVSESGSSRSLGDLFDRARNMSLYYVGLADNEDNPIVSTGPVINRIRRGFS